MSHAWVWIGHLRTIDGDLVATFAIDERQYPDADSAQAALNTAAAELRRRRIPYELEHVRVRRDSPAEPLPSWAEYRASLPDAPA